MKARIRIRMGSNNAHYAGGLVDGAKMLELFGDVATELCIRADGDEGLFRAYDAVEFLAPVRAGDFIEAEGTITRWGKTSLGMEFVARKVIVPTPRRDDTFESSADLLARADRRLSRARHLRRAGERAPHRASSGGRGRASSPPPSSAPRRRARRIRTCRCPPTSSPPRPSAARRRAPAVIHLHVRDEEGRASQEGKRFRDAIREIRARTDVIIQTSTGGAVGMSVAERAGPLECTGADAPEMATLNVGTINFGEDVFMNKAADTAEMAKRIARPRRDARDRDVRRGPPRHRRRSGRSRGSSRAPLHLQFVLGVRGALSASERNLEYPGRAHGDAVPRGATWGVAGIGRHQLPMAELAAMWGGNARVGLEDNIYLDKGVLAEGSAPLVARAVELCRRHGRKVATVAEARAQLGLPHARVIVLLDTCDRADANSSTFIARGQP